MRVAHEQSLSELTAAAGMCTEHGGSIFNLTASSRSLCGPGESKPPRAGLETVLQHAPANLMLS
jgi:hypothetical protein